MSRLLNVASAAAVAMTVTAVLMLSEPGNAADLVSAPTPALIPVVQEITVPVPAPVTNIVNEASPSGVAADEDAANPVDTLAELVDATPIPDTIDDQLRCLAGTVYFESKGETLAGQLAVAHVVINRANSGRFPSSLCGVVYQRSQFSFVRGGRMPSIPESSRAWEKAVAIAQIALDGDWDSKAPGALYFHASSVSPNWGRARIARIDHHIFYR